jgi:deoxyribonuclease-4
MHTHFTSVRYRNGKFVDEHEPIEREMPPFEPLARELAKRDITITLICESPLLEKDALLMKQILEKQGVFLT